MSVSLNTDVVRGSYGEFEIYRQDEHVRSQMLIYGAHQRTDLELALGLLGPGDRVLDLGAHVGSFAVPFAKAIGKKGRIVCVEASDSTFAMLKGNIERNGIDNAELLHTVVAATAGEFVPSADVSAMRNSGALRWKRVAGGEAASTHRSMSIEAVLELLDYDVAYIKMDLEGYDAEIIEALPFDRLKRRPIISFEYAKPQTAAGAIARLREQKYRLLVNLSPRDTGILGPIAGDLAELGDKGQRLFDIYAIPEEAAILKKLVPARAAGSRTLMRLLRMGRNAEAVEAYKAIKDPTRDDIAAYAKVLAELERHEESAAEIRGLLDADDGNPYLWDMLSHQYRSSNQLDPALEAARRALSAQPGNPAFLVTFARACFALDRTDEGMAAAEKALVLLPTHTRMVQTMTQFKLQAGKLDEALALARTAAESSPDSLKAQLALLRVYMQQEDWPAASEVATRCIMLDPTSAPAHFAMSRVLIRQKKGRLACKMADRAVSLEPGNARFKAWADKLGERIRERGGEGAKG